MLKSQASELREEMSRFSGDRRALNGGRVELPLQITWRNLDKSPAVETDIRARAEKLNEFHDRIVSCRVVVEASHRNHHKGNLFRVRIDVKVPEHELVITRDPADEHAHEDLYVTVRDAFDAMSRQLKDVASAQNGRRRASTT